MSLVDKPILVYATFPSLEVAEAIGGEMVERRLAACVNILHGMVSIYMWKGARVRDSEVAMVLKTRAGLADQVLAEVARLHPYDNPALLVLEPSGGAQAFLDWIMAETGGGGDASIPA